MSGAFVTPPPLDEGEQVAVLAPSNPAPDVAVEVGVRRLRGLGLAPVVYDSARADERLPPAERAAEIARAFEDPDVKAAVAATGGDDQLRVLSHLDTAVLREHPTRFFGISDNTNLHALLWSAGVVSFYGGQFVPGVALDDGLHPYTRRYLERALFEESLGEIRPAGEWTDGYYDFGTREPREWEDNEGWTFEGDGVVEGRVWGGCLEVLQWLLAADRCVPRPDDLDGAVLAVETSEELPTAREVGRILTCMGERGLLGRFGAVLVGRPRTRHETPRTAEERLAYRENQRAAIRRWLDRYNPDVPVVFDVDFGHTDPHVPLPVGGMAVVDAEDERIAFDFDR